MEFVKNILIKLPNLKNESMMALPFLFLVAEQYPKAKINLIMDKGVGWIINFMPIKMNVYELPKEKMSLFEMHHYCANMHDIFNVDLYFDLENSLASAFMGMNFRAKERIGFEMGMNKIFYTKKFKNNPSLDFESKGISLFEDFINQEIPELKLANHLRVFEEEMSNVIPLFKLPEKKPFIMILLDNFENVHKQIDHWKSFFDSFEKQRFVIWSIENEDVISDLFLSIDRGHNELFMHKGKNAEEFKYVLSNVEGVITNNPICEGLGVYFMMDTFSFIFEESASFKYKYFENKPIKVNFLEKKIIYKRDDEESEMTEINEVVDQIHQILKL